MGLFLVAGKLAVFTPRDLSGVLTKPVSLCRDANQALNGIFMHGDLNAEAPAAGNPFSSKNQTDKQFARPTNEHVIEDFCDAMAEQDIRANPADIIADGKLHRIHADGDGKNVKDAWYVLHADDKPAGKFGHNGKYGYDVSFPWSMRVERAPMSADEKRAYREKIEADRARREAEDIAQREAAARLANRMWDAATPITGDDHPYLKRKNIQSYGLRVGTWEKVDQATGEVSLISKQALLVPIWGLGKNITALQAILPDSKKLGRDKDYLSGADKRGRFFSIGKPLEHEGKFVILLCEGYATGASLHAATGHAVIVAFDAPNLLPVAEIMRERFPEAIIVVCADNDQWTLKPVKNPGVTRAMEVRDAIGALVAVPEFDEALGVANDAGKIKGPNDFNDLAHLEGDEAVCRVIAAALNPPAVVAPVEEIPPEYAALPVPPWEDIPHSGGVDVLDTPADDSLPGMMFVQSAPVLPTTVGADLVRAAPRKDPREFDPCAPIAMGSSGDLYAFWTSAKKVELIKASDLFRDAGILRLQDLNYWQNYCVVSGVSSSPSAKYDRVLVGNMLLQKSTIAGELGTHNVPESVAPQSVVDRELNVAMLKTKGSA
jgi:phage/plasmid primase-like uncharacterized protein